MNVLVTGSTRGIGLAVARLFAQNGHTVFLNGRDEVKLKEAADAFQGSIIPIATDITDYGRVAAMFDGISRLGSLDVLVNNAGISQIQMFQDSTPEDWRQIVNINIFGMLNCSLLAARQMLKRKSGVIINISSVWGERGASCETIYSMTKGAVNAFTKSLAKELAPSGIRVNAVSCGIVDTQMNDFLSNYEKRVLATEIPLNRFAAPEEIAEAVFFLASEKASYITGEILSVDGGF